MVKVYLFGKMVEVIMVVGWMEGNMEMEWYV